MVYADGHEHNLQYFKVNDTHFIMSGSGCKTQHVRTGRDAGAMFSDKEKGFSRVNYYANGEVWTEYWIPSGNGETGRMVFRTPLYAKKPSGAVAQLGTVDEVGSPSPLRSDFRDSTVTVAINPRYAQRSRLFR